jgi:3-oxoacyl-[acyl-carrier-protein] synthase-3
MLTDSPGPVSELPVRFAGLGWYLPESRVTNAELEARLGLPAGWIERKTGVLERRYASGETPAAMAASAARAAITGAGLRVEDLDAIIGASSAPQQMVPCTAALVQRELRAPDGRSACFDINATCLSFLFAVQAAAHLLAAHVYERVLIFSTELTAHSLNPREPESAALLGDAAAAVVLTNSRRTETSAVIHARFTTFSTGAHLTEVLGGGTLHHPNDPATTPEMNYFHMIGPLAFRQVGCALSPFLNGFLRSIGWEPRTIDAVVPHQASRAIEYLIPRFGFRSDQVILDLPFRGNCAAASIPLAMAEAVHNGRIRRGDNVLLVGAGAGLTVGALALKF